MVLSRVGFCCVDNESIWNHNHLELEVVHLLVTGVLALLVVSWVADCNLLCIQTPSNQKIIWCTLIFESILVRSPTNRIFVSKHQLMLDLLEDHQDQ